MSGRGPRCAAIPKFVPAWFVGHRTIEDGITFMSDLASRMRSRVQITTDGLAIYLDSVPSAFKKDVDFAQLVKVYSGGASDETHARKPSRYLGATRSVVLGSLDERSISTSHVEGQNLTMRTQMRRFTRRTNGVSKKFANHRAAVALHFHYYNFARPHLALKGATPAQAAGIDRYRWTAEEIAALLDDPQYADALRGQPGQTRPASPVA